MNLHHKIRPLMLAIALIVGANSSLLGHSPADTAFAVDIHDVLMEKRLGAMIGDFLANPSLIPKIGHLSNGSYGNNVKLRNVINRQKPIKGTWYIMQELKKAGYTLYIFSNIDKTAFEELKAKFPALFALFDEFHVVHNNNAAQKKPAPAAYESCKALFAQKHPDKNIIFIDDKKENILAARKAGIMGIRFKTPEQLKNTLKVCYNITV